MEVGDLTGTAMKNKLALSIFPFRNISDIPEGAELKEITDPERLKHVEPGIQVYEMAWTNKDRIAGRPLLIKWRGYAKPVNDQVKQPIKIEMWQKVLGEDKEFVFWHTVKISYPTRDRLRGKRKDGDASALAYKRCGQCLTKCPNNVPIIQRLAETVELLVGK